MWTVKRSPTTDPNDWDPYSGDFSEPYTDYYLIDGEYYPEYSEKVNSVIKNKSRVYRKIDVYEKGNYTLLYFK